MTGVGASCSRLPSSFTQSRLFQVPVQPGALWEWIRYDVGCVLHLEKADLHGCGCGVVGWGGMGQGAESLVEILHTS